MRRLLVYLTPFVLLLLILLSSLPSSAQVQTTVSGAGNSMKPDSAPHQLSSRT